MFFCNVLAVFNSLCYITSWNFLFCCFCVVDWCCYEMRASLVGKTWKNILNTGNGESLNKRQTL